MTENERKVEVLARLLCESPGLCTESGTMDEFRYEAFWLLEHGVEVAGV